MFSLTSGNSEVFLYVAFDVKSSKGECNQRVTKTAVARAYICLKIH